MTFPDNASDAGKQQLAAQFDFFHSLTTRMFENAERILALNLETTRATLDQASGAARQLAAAKDPRDLLALGAQSQQQVEAVMAYSRKLLEITNKPAAAPVPQESSAPEPVAAAPAPDAHIDTAPPVMVDEPAQEAAPPPAAAAQPAPARSAILPSKHPMGEADPEPAPAITAKATPIAEAAGIVAAAPVDTPHPVASPMPEPGAVAIPAITPVDATEPPPEAAAPPEPKRARGGKKR